MKAKSVPPPNPYPDPSRKVTMVSAVSSETVGYSSRDRIMDSRSSKGSMGRVKLWPCREVWELASLLPMAPPRAALEGPGPGLSVSSRPSSGPSQIPPP